MDVHDFSLLIPTLEYHNRTWTWHDLLMAMKKDCVNVLVSQVSSSQYTFPLPLDDQFAFIRFYYAFLGRKTS